jgi:hypothetical protein
MDQIGMADHGLASGIVIGKGKPVAGIPIFRQT